MSPEQAQGLAVDHRSDLFSLGSLLYEMVAGASPFRSASAVETLARICACDPRPIPDLAPATPEELVRLTHRLLSKSPAQRPQSAPEVCAALDRIERSGVLDRSVPADLTGALTADDTTQVDPRARAAGARRGPRAADLERTAPDDRPLLRAGGRRQPLGGFVAGVRRRDPLRADAAASAAGAGRCAAPRRHTGEHGRAPGAARRRSRFRSRGSLACSILKIEPIARPPPSAARRATVVRRRIRLAAQSIQKASSDHLPCDTPPPRGGDVMPDDSPPSRDRSVAIGEPETAAGHRAAAAAPERRAKLSCGPVDGARTGTNHACVPACVIPRALPPATRGRRP